VLFTAVVFPLVELFGMGGVSEVVTAAVQFPTVVFLPIELVGMGSVNVVERAQVLFTAVVLCVRVVVVIVASITAIVSL